jgi:DNA-binding CsgD family transcriptional regulator
LAACRSERLAGSIVTGEAGVGKTRLARAVAEVWSLRGTVTWVAGSESARRFMFGAFGELVADLDGDDFGNSADRIVSTLSASAAPLLVVDDAHLLDDASAAVVHGLAVRPGAVPMLITTSAGRAVPAGVMAAGKDGLLEHVELAPLNSAATAAVLQNRLGAPVERATATKLFELSGGNPAVLLELVAAGSAAGSLVLGGGIWSWRGSVPRSDGLAELLQSRLSGLGPEAWRTLELLALGEPLGLRELTGAVGTDAIAAAEAHGLLVIERLGRRRIVRSVEPLYAQLLRAELGQARTLQRLHELDRMIEHVPARRSQDVLQRAVARLETGVEEPGDAAVLTEASKLARPDYALAERLARAALERGGGFRAFDYLIDALVWQGKLEEATELAASVAEYASPEELAYFSLRWSRMRWWMAGERPADEGDAGEAVQLETAESVGLRTADHLSTVARQAAMEAAAGRGAQALTVALSVLADDRCEDEGRCWAAGAAMIGLGGDGRVSDALALVPEAYASAARLQDYNYRLLLSVVDVRLRRLSGDLGGGSQAVADLRDALAGAQDPNSGIVALIEAEMVLATGRALEAIPYCRDAAAQLDQLDFGGLSATAHLRLAEALAFTGDTVGADEQLLLASATEDHTLELFRPEQLVQKAWLQLASGGRKEGLALLGRASALAVAQTDRLVELLACHAGVRAGDHSAARHLVVLADSVEGAFALSAARHAAALIGRDPAGLLAAADEFAGIGALAQQADAVAQAARLEQRSGDAGRARQLATRAADIAADTGGIQTPALRAAQPGVALTKRQRDVARLAARGYSSLEIAERLGVGVRTVESHLDAAYRRLGVSNRKELAQLWRSN